MPGSCALQSPYSWFEPLSRAKVPRLRLFCFPHAGGSADVCRAWQRWLPEELDICLVHLPGHGRNMGEQPFTRLAPLVSAVADYINHETTIPHGLYGHSMGALICFELARELCRHGPGPQHLFVSGHGAPQWPRSRPPIFNLPHAEFISELKRLNGTPAELFDNPELLELFLNILRADFEILDTYEYRDMEPLSCPITVYGGLADQHVSTASCHAWERQTSATCTVRMFKGDHFFIRNPGREFTTAFRADLLNAVSPPLQNILK
jgi:medium-chain acyl-[acyl-carrier-protein] hydrolase